ncbi:mechanosensitive ion channel-like protein [Sphingobacterium alimentarium]|uniref:Mechanosensitive ion channel-like protein n=2 Tax=Sphingobacterium alimentarium TaxID=797292 RepID=A0A4V2VU75_9SPHI|nr:mechanosensitive ion channel-like protein [Sphingobacterium alimentarium]
MSNFAFLFFRNSYAMKRFISRFIFLFLLISLHYDGLAQDSVSQPASRLSSDTSRHILSDSLRKELQGLDVGYLANIHIRDIQNILTELSAKSESHILKKKSATPDSIAVIDRLIRDDITQLRSMHNSLNNYQSSVTTTKNAIQHIINKYQVSEEKYPRLALRLNSSLAQVNSKLDSIHAASASLSTLITANELYLGEKVIAGNPAVTAPAEKKSTSIWNSSSQNISRETIINNIKENYQRNNSFSRYFNDIPWNSRILLLLICIAYAFWCFKTKLDIDKKNGIDLSKTWILKVIGKSTIVYFTLLPLVSLFTPTFIIQASQIIIIALYLGLAFGTLTAQQRKIMSGIVLFYILIVFANMMVSDDMFLRVICMLFNIIAIALVSYSKKRIKNKESAGYINNAIYIIFVLLNVTAIVMNIIGKVNISRSFSIASAVGLMQSFTLRFFIEMIRDDLHRQFEKDNLYNGFWLRFNRERMTKLGLDLLKLICVLLAIVVLANNLNFIDTLVNFSENVLERKRKIGDITFSFANLIIAILLLLITNWLQKNISLILLGGENGQLRQGYNQKVTLFPLFRLAIILVGFFFAISALGMSLDKLTVIIGALSVGIGLGMQNIINNFVSGIILVFDKPFRVGDQIELADKKGRVKEIGIRASILQTGDGANVIIPNGDLLSGRVVNWTLSHEYSKVSFTILVDRNANLQQVHAWVEEAAAASKYYLKNMGLKTSVKDISADTIHLNVLAWVNYASNADAFKSDVLLQLYKKFDADGLKFQSV